MDKEQITKSLLESGDGQDDGSGQLERTDLMLATVAAVYADGLTLIFDGETTASQKRYKKLSTYFGPTAGDRVVVMKMSGTYIVMGAIGGSAMVPASALPIIPITKGGTGQSGIYKTNDISEILVQKSGFTVSRAEYAQYGKVAMLRCDVTPETAQTSSSLLSPATLVSGKRPVYQAIMGMYNTDVGYITTYGDLYVYTRMSSTTGYYSLYSTYLLA